MESTLPQLRSNSRRLNWKARAVASAVHLAISGLAALIVLTVVYRCWYPAPLDRIVGVGPMLVLLIGVDVCLGPLLTFVVFDRRKKGLRRDLATIALVQAVALSYGLVTVEKGRPHYLVFVKDRFEVVSMADLRPEDVRDASGNEAARTALMQPVWACAQSPANEAERTAVLMESIEGGRDLQHLPRLYVPLQSHLSELKSAGTPLKTLIDRLRTKNAGSDLARLERAVHTMTSDEFGLGWVPIRGPAGDGIVLFDADTGQRRLIVDVDPWR